MKKLFLLIVVLFVSCKKTAADKNNVIMAEIVEENLKTENKNTEETIPLKEEVCISETKEEVFISETCDFSAQNNEQCLYLLYKEKKVEYICKGLDDRTSLLGHKYIADILDYIEYYYKDDKNYIFIGKITTEGIFDRENNNIYAWDEESFDKESIVGFVSELKEHPLLINLVVSKDEELFSKKMQKQLYINHDDNSLSVRQIIPKQED